MTSKNNFVNKADSNDSYPLSQQSAGHQELTQETIALLGVCCEAQWEHLKHGLDSCAQ